MEFNILGKSNSSVSIILENLFSIHNYSYHVNIVKNMEDTSDIPYIIPGIKVDEINHDIFKFDLEKRNYIIGAIRVPAKQNIYNFFNDNYGLTDQNYKTIIPQNTAISQTCKLGNGCLLNYGCIMAPYSKLGNFVTINRNSSIGHHTFIDDFSTINPGVNIAGGCLIGKGVTIGMGSNIIENIKIGDGAIVGAGSLVLKDVPANTTVYGSPAKAK
ncbi:glycosyltransferase [Klosneuvirus KNV1]|uniref:Glycosyltransferase n=1 Tax=Klosneuvirus KNV1 TaxID=1977640 RepID=A0A1V0SLA4_9VIRU|nr:glycosyltransferase [Klosneuvirus KNV1]